MNIALSLMDLDNWYRNLLIYSISSPNPGHWLDKIPYQQSLRYLL